MKLKELLEVMERCLICIYDGEEENLFYSHEVPYTFADMSLTYVKVGDARLYVKVE